MIKNKWQKILLTVGAGISSFSPIVHAAGIIPSCATGNDSNCGLNDMLQLGVNIANWILGIVGAVALLFFVYGGFVFILSAGNEEKVKEGKTILMNAIIGLVIVFASYLIIQFSAGLLGAKVSPGLLIGSSK
jgi:Type IV secretion system pilin